MSNYTDLQEIRNYSEENNASVNNTIDEKIYPNTEQEITPDMVNEAIKAVEDDRFNNTENVIDFIERKAVKNVKIRLYDGLGVEWSNENNANIYTEPLSSILLIQVPKYTNIYVDSLTTEMWQHSCVLIGFVDGDEITGEHRYASIDNWQYTGTSAQYREEKIYRVYGGTDFLPDTVRPWSEDSELSYISTKDTTIVLTVRDEMNVSEFYYSPGVVADDVDLMEAEEEVESLTFEENNFFDNGDNVFNMKLSQNFGKQYYFDAVNDVTKAFKSKVMYNQQRIRFNHVTSKWQYVSSTYPYMRIIRLSPLDTFTLKGYKLTDLGVTSNSPISGNSPIFAKIWPTIEALSNDWSEEPVTYEAINVNYTNVELKITNTTESTIFIWFTLDEGASGTPYMKINGNDVCYDISNYSAQWLLRGVDFYNIEGELIIANNSGKIDMLYKEISKLHKILYDIVQNI